MSLIFNLKLRAFGVNLAHKLHHLARLAVISVAKCVENGLFKSKTNSKLGELRVVVLDQRLGNTLLYFFKIGF